MSRGMEATQARLVHLHQLRDKIDEEIAALEGAIVRASKAREQAMRMRGKERRPRRRATALCGTDGGYYRHRRTLNEPACDECKLAHRVAEQIRVAKKRQTDTETEQGAA